jgi:3-oxoacyl-[acyl-carrier-protein] synthase-1
MDVVTQTRECELTTVMSNSFGFGGTNATLVMQKYQG